MALTWKDIDKELQKQLKEHKYSFREAWETIGCGEVVLRRYMAEGLVVAIKTSDQWYFTQDQVNKATFINHFRKKKKWGAVTFLAGLYDYLIEHNCECAPEELEEYMEKYNV